MVNSTVNQLKQKKWFQNENLKKINCLNGSLMYVVIIKKKKFEVYFIKC